MKSNCGLQPVAATVAIMKDTDPQTPSATAVSDVAPGRRRFLGRGAAVAPVLVTLAAQPALGTTCYSPSGSLSKNTTGGRTYTGDCRGESSGNYKQQTKNWPSSYKPGDLLSKMFPAGPYLSSFKSGNATKTLQQVMNLTGNEDPNQFAFHMIGAVLNCERGLVPSGVMTVGQLRTIWTTLYTGAGTMKVGSQTWDKARFVSYLKEFKIVG